MAGYTTFSSVKMAYTIYLYFVSVWVGWLGDVPVEYLRPSQYHPNYGYGYIRIPILSLWENFCFDTWSHKSL